MSNKSKWFLPINFCNQTGNWSFRSCTHFRISVAQSLYQHHQSPWSCDFPCVASIYLCNSTTYCYTCSRWVSRSLSVTPIASHGVTPWNSANYKLMFNCIYRVIWLYVWLEWVEVWLELVMYDLIDVELCKCLCRIY